MPTENFTINLENVRDDFFKEFKSTFSRKSFEQKIDRLKQADDDVKIARIMDELYDMFETCGIRCERNQNVDYYESLINRVEFYDYYDLEEKLLCVLYSNYQKFPSPEKYMKRIVDRMSKNFFDDWDNDSLRVRILKQFIKYGNYLYDAGCGSRAVIKRYAKNNSGKAKIDESEICDFIDDGIFSLLDDENVTHDDKKFDGKLGLLRLADDLASGNFRTGSGIKRGLYYFAMAFGMTWNKDNPKSDVEKNQSDVEKNLFQDYYNDNLLRYISENYRNAPSDFEAEPSGQGINYKNFAEIVCLYFIAHDNYEICEKIKLSSEMIKRLKNSTSNDKNPLRFDQSQVASILHKTPEEFERFVRDNYNCNTGGNLGVFQVEPEQDTALALYLELINDTERYRDNEEDGLWEGLWFADVEKLKEKYGRALLSVNPNEDNLNDFIGLLNAIDSRLKRHLSKDIGSASMTRTLLVTAYYHYFTTKHESDAYGKWCSFKFLFNEMKSELDIELKQAGYQPFSSKIIIDVLFAFSAWAYLNC